MFVRIMRNKDALLRIKNNDKINKNKVYEVVNLEDYKYEIVELMRELADVKYHKQLEQLDNDKLDFIFKEASLMYAEEQQLKVE